MKSKRKYSLGLLLLLAVVWRSVFFAASVECINVSGDESIMALQSIGLTQCSDDPLFQTKQHPRGLGGRFPLLFMAQPYLFPFESYVAAPLIRLLPNTAFGLRLIPALLGLLGCFIGMLLLREWLSRGWKDDDGLVQWLPVLLIAVPSAYVLMLQCVYMLPSYPGFMVLSMLALWLANRHRSCDASWNPLWALLSGLCAGLATSNTLMTLPFLGALGVQVAVGRNWRKMLTGLPAFAVGALAGLVPFYLAKQLYPGAHAAVSSTVPFGEALGRLWSPAVTFTLPVVLGLRSTLMPDTLEMVGFVPSWCLPVGAVLWLLFMVGVTVLCVVRFIQRTVRAKWPDIHLADVMMGLSWVYLLLFVLSTRFGSHEFRYLLPVALFFPFLMGWTLLQCGKGVRKVLLAACALLLVINVVTSLMLLRAWTAESFSGYFTDTRPAIEYLRGRGIDRCYSSYFDAYTINYLSGEEVVCAQPFNERFFGWPYPYVDLVDRATNVAYVLGPGHRFRRKDFEKDMADRGITYQKTECGLCSVYTDFVTPERPKGRVVDASRVRVETSHHDSDSSTLADGVLTHEWRSHGAQERGMWIRLRLAEPVVLERIRFYYNGYPYDHAVSLNIYSMDQDEKKEVLMAIPFVLTGFDFVNDHPVYGYQVQDVALNGLETGDLLIELNEANAGRDWTIGEIELYEAVREP